MDVDLDALERALHAVRPFTQFTAQEQTRLNDAERKLAALQLELQALRTEVQALAAPPSATPSSPAAGGAAD